MGNRWLLKGIRGGVISSITFTDNSIVRYFDQPRVRKPAYTVGGKRGTLK
jgi:hypothetical protein